jgi:hypothetical protein
MREIVNGIFYVMRRLRLAAARAPSGTCFMTFETDP